MKDPTRPRTARRMTLEGAILDTYQTEAELDGFRATQGAMLDRDAYRRPAPMPADQGRLL